MNLLITFLRITLAILILLLCFIVLNLTGGARGGTNDYLLVIGGYLLVGIMCGLVLMYKRKVSPVKTFTGFQ